jgi:uncharacterized protein YqjF (DUF2071 family)
MGYLGTSPLTMVGELHEVLLVNFSLPEGLLRERIPAPLVLDLLGGRAVISMVSVKLRWMRPSGLPKLLGFHYHHVAYRVVVNGPKERGIYFLRSFADKRFIVAFGNALSEYQFERAGITYEERDGQMSLGVTARDPARTAISARLSTERGELPRGSSFPDLSAAKEFTGPLTRAFSVSKKGAVTKVEIAREAWPIQPLTLESFANSEFPEAKPEAAFCVREPIHYRWKRAVKVE